MLYLYNQWK